MIKMFRLSTMTDAELQPIMQRSRCDILNVKDDVEQIINTVRAQGDKALIDYTRKFDDPQFSVERLKVTKADIALAYEQTDSNVVAKIKEQIRLSSRFHTLQKEHIRSWEASVEDGIEVGEKWTPIANVGLYIPGGKNPFPTVQQILAVPAKLAGCTRVISCISPRGNNFEVLIAANECGLEEIYRVSGAQAIAAMAYGTETIKPVDLIAGPGSPFVTAAKILCQQQVAIDMPAGPSEVLILADDTLADGFDIQTKASYCAADMLAQAEHGPDSACVLVTNSPELAESTKQEIERQSVNLTRNDFLEQALRNYSAIIITESMEDAIAFTNKYAPEHLEILTANPKQTLELIEHTGSAFLGYHSPVAAGDYAIGINHTLPASGWARQFSPVGVWTFMKRVQYSQVTKAGLQKLSPIVQTISAVEGLDAHRKSVEMRFENMAGPVG